MDTYEKILTVANLKFGKLVKKPAKFLDDDSALFEDTKLLSKVIYDASKLTEESHTGTMPELLIQNFDEEQVWAGIELQNEARMKMWRKQFSQLNLEDTNILLGEKKIASKSEAEWMGAEESSPTAEDPTSDIELSDVEVGEEDKQEEPTEPDKLSDVEDMDSDIMNDPDFQNMSDSEGDDLPLFENLSDDDKSGDEEGTYRAKEKQASKSRSTEVDDQFFKLRDMEQFLDIEDRKEERKSKSQDEDDNDDIDLFDDVGDMEEESGAMYNEYFQDGGGESPPLNHQEEEGGEDDENDDDDDDDDDDDVEQGLKKKDLLEDSDDNLAADKETLPESSHEKAEQRMLNKIKKLEEMAIGDKPWQMAGEVAAPVRPENSLLAEDLDYESGVRAAPVITEEVARKLEDIIKQRIKDQAWDDVIRKIKPVEDPQEYRKKLVLDQEKSKLSLAQIYEEEFLKISAAKEKTVTPGLLEKENEETPEEVQAIKAAMNSLFAKLDTLTHFHYTPKQKTAEVKIVRNVASIAIEEVAPVGASNADLLAPAEVVDKQKSELMGDLDKSATDKKRERRKKKLKIKATIKEKERKEKEKSDRNENKLMSKTAALKNIENSEKQGKLKTVKESRKDNALKSSTAFFKQLQDETSTNVNKKHKGKKEKKAVSLSALKL